MDGLNSHTELHDLSAPREFLREIVLGFNDGLVSMFGLTAGLAGAYAQNSVIAVAGVLGAIAAAISMGLGTYISMKSQKEVYDHEIEREKREMEEVPEIERDEIRQIYREKGFKGKLLEQIVKQITSDKKIWLKVMMEEELGFGKTSFKDPIKGSVLNFFAFLVGAIIPIFPYLIVHTQIALITSIIASIGGLFLAGALKGRLTGLHWFRTGFELLLIGVIASAASYYIGTVIGAYIGVSV
jgi:vacuolar iron transporter family protein